MVIVELRMQIVWTYFNKFTQYIFLAFVISRDYKLFLIWKKLTLKEKLIKLKKLSYLVMKDDDEILYPECFISFPREGKIR